jgi:hypothetical protein
LMVNKTIIIKFNSHLKLAKEKFEGPNITLT